MKSINKTNPKIQHPNLDVFNQNCWCYKVYKVPSLVKILSFSIRISLCFFTCKKVLITGIHGEIK